MTVKEQLVRELDKLDENELREVGNYVRFVRVRSRISPPPQFDEQQVAKLYAESAEEERSLAEEGMNDYAKGLSKEDRP